MKTVWQLLKTLNIKLLYEPTITFLDIYLWIETKIDIYPKNLYTNVHTSIQKSVHECS